MHERDEFILPSDESALANALEGLSGYGSPFSKELVEKEDDIIDRYRLIRLIDSGGMGNVWLAEQLDPICQQVALKIIKLGMDSEAILARFEIERQALAMMDHPSIAKVFDGGATESGRPFFVMEYVDGCPITMHAKEANLSLRDRLELFVKVCSAVQHAHQKTVIHRDLKPSNILVTEIDGQAIPKIIDFGIAKIMNDGACIHTLITSPGQILGTLGYMSPEQTSMGNSVVDTRSDVYSLGAVLYELMTDSPPYDTNVISSANPTKAVDAICNEMPRRPSTRLHGKDQSLHQPLLRLGGLLRSELDCVVMKALEKEPERRYQAVAELSADVRNLLENRPVKARSQNLVYSTRKWIKRNRVLVNMVLLATVTALGVFGFTRMKWEEEREYVWLRRVLEADSAEVLAILDERKSYSRSIQQELRKHDEIDTKIGLHSYLARLPHEASLTQPLLETMLSAEAEVLAVIRDALQPHRDSLSQSLWGTLVNENLSESRRFRAAVALATYEPENELWQAHATNVADWLTSQLNCRPWLEHLNPIVPKLLLHVEDDHFANESPLIRQNAAIIISRLQRRTDRLIHAVKRAHPDQITLLVGAFHDNPDRIKALAAEIKDEPLCGETEDEKNEEAAAQARAGFMLMHLGHPQRVKRFLTHTGENEDPRRRSFLIHGFAENHVDLTTIIPWIEDRASKASVLRASLLALGEYTLSAERVSLLIPKMERLFLNHPDPGVHSSVEWLLREWKQAHPNLNIHIPNPEIRRDPDHDKRWYVNQRGITMCIVKGPITFFMGSPECHGDIDNATHERQLMAQRHERRIPRTFAIACKPLTFAQFEEFFPDYLEHAAKSNFLYRGTRNHLSPNITLEAVSLHEAFQYCNWLSKKEGLPPDQYCYQSSDGGELVPKANALSLAGYRLATEAEWEYACRAGAVTRRPYGNAISLMSKYIWCESNSGGRTRPPGLLRPNDLGMFDMLGNGFEWVHGRYTNYPRLEEGICEDTDAQLRRHLSQETEYVSRGSFFGTPEIYVEASTRNVVKFPELRSGKTIRVARTLTQQQSTK